MYWLHLSLRYLLAVLFLAAGTGKLLDNRGFADVLSTYQSGLPEHWLLVLGFGFALSELLIGWHLLRGHYVRTCLLLTLIYHLGYALVTSITYARGIALNNCGCFGVFLARPLEWYTPLEDLVLAVVSTCALLTLPAAKTEHR